MQAYLKESMNEEDFIVVNPSRFILPDVQGVMMPDRTKSGRRLWRVYLSWRNGKREAVKLNNPPVLSDGTKVVFHPIPAKRPSDDQVDHAPWSAESRADWLKGVV